MAELSKLRAAAALKPLSDEPASAADTVRQTDAQGFGEAAPAPARKRGRPRTPPEEASRPKARTKAVKVPLPIDLYKKVWNEALDEDRTPASLIVRMLVDRYKKPR